MMNEFMTNLNGIRLSYPSNSLSSGTSMTTALPWGRDTDSTADAAPSNRFDLRVDIVEERRAVTRASTCADDGNS